jgi:hypothetical protein
MRIENAGMTDLGDDMIAGNRLSNYLERLRRCLK